MKKLLAAVTVLAVSTAQADTIYVDVNCPGPGNGSEADPYCSIQTAIDNAVDTQMKSSCHPARTSRRSTSWARRSGCTVLVVGM